MFSKIVFQPPTLSWSLTGFSGLSPFLLGSLVLPPPTDLEFDLTIDFGSVPLFPLSGHSSVRSPRNTTLTSLLASEMWICLVTIYWRRRRSSFHQILDVTWVEMKFNLNLRVTKIIFLPLERLEEELGALEGGFPLAR